MSLFRRLPLFPTTLLLLVALVGSASFEAHEPRGHLSDSGGGYEAGSVSLAGHADADDSLHIESLHGIEHLHCVGCLLRQSRNDMVLAKQATVHGLVASAVATATDGRLPAEPSRYSGAPRGPPALVSFSS